MEFEIFQVTYIYLNQFHDFFWFDLIHLKVPNFELIKRDFLLKIVRSGFVFSNWISKNKQTILLAEITFRCLNEEIWSKIMKCNDILKDDIIGTEKVSRIMKISMIFSGFTKFALMCSEHWLKSFYSCLVLNL